MSLTRRRALTAAIAAGLAAPALRRARAQAVTWRYGHQFDVNHPVHAGMLRAAQVLRERSSGRITLNIFPSSQLGTGREVVQQVSDGTVEFTHEGPGALSAWTRTLSIFEAPFIARDWPHLVKMIESQWGTAQYGQLSQGRNLLMFATPWYYGTRQTTTRDRALRTVADARGLKLRVPEVPLFLDMVRAIGATPTPMALAEVYLSLQTGVVDGQENPLPTINSQKFYEVQRFLNLTAHIITPYIPLVNRQKFEAMSAADKELVRGAFNEGGQVSDRMFFDLESSLTRQFQQHGMQVIESDRSTFQQAMLPVYQRYETVWGAGVFEQMRAIT